MNYDVFDVETTRFPSGNPNTKGTFLVSWAVKSSSEIQVLQTRYYKDPDFIRSLGTLSKAWTLVVGINLKFDFQWLIHHGIELPERCRVWDCQIAEFVMSGQTNSFASMDDLCAKYGIKGKEGGLEDYWDKGINTQDIPSDVVLSYNAADTERTESIYLAQLKDERMTPALKRLIILMGADLLVLAHMEYNGLKYNVEGSLAKANELKLEQKAIEKELNEFAGTDQLNWDSGDHLSCFLFGGSISIDYFELVESVYKSGRRIGETYTSNKFKETKEYKFDGYFLPLENSEVKKSTPEKRLYQVSEPVLLKLKKQSKAQKRIIELLLKRAELEKLIGTYLEKIPALLEEKQWGEYVHGTYNQVVARTGRLSSSAPSMQNNSEEVDRFFISRFD